MSPTDGYTIDDARHAMGLSAPDEELYQAAELAVLEHERAERLERNGQARERLLTRRTDALRAAERRVAELEQWRADVTHAVEALTERKVEHFSSCDWCGACSPEEAEGRCEPREDQTGERSCPAIDGPVAEVWDDGANPVVLLLREELQHAALVSDELKRLAARVADLETACQAHELAAADLEARAVRAEAAARRLLYGRKNGKHYYSPGGRWQVYQCNDDSWSAGALVPLPQSAPVEASRSDWFHGRPTAHAAAIDLLRNHPELWPEEPAETDPLREAAQDALRLLEAASHKKIHWQVICSVCGGLYPCHIEKARRRLAAALEDR